MKAKDNKTCLKLLQKYADSHELLQQENKMLRHLLEDYEKNIKINKAIIENLVLEQSRSSSGLECNDTTNISCNISGSKNNSNSNTLNNASHNSMKRVCSCNRESSMQMINSLTEENHNLSKTVNETVNEMENLRRRLYVSESVAIDRTSEITKEHENLKNKIFVLEHLVLKRDNQMNNYKEKYEKLSDAENRLYVEKEVLVTDPSVSLSAIHEELILYKNSYANLSNYCNSIKSSLFTYEKANNRIMDENTNLKLYIREKNRENYAQNLILKSEITKRTYNTDNNMKEDNLKKQSNCDDNAIKENYGVELTNYNGKAFLETLSKRHRSSSQNKKSLQNVPIVAPKNEEKKLNISSNSAFNQNEVKQGSILNRVMPIYADDWCEVIKQAGLSLAEVMSLKEHKGNSLILKIAEAMEYFNQVISDKDVHIDLLLAENEKLNTEIMGLMNEIDTLKQKLKSSVGTDNLSINQPYSNYNKDRVSVVDSINNMNNKLYSTKSKPGQNQFKPSNPEKQDIQERKEREQFVQDRSSKINSNATDKSSSYRRQGRKSDIGLKSKDIVDERIQEFKMQFKNKISENSKPKVNAGKKDQSSTSQIIKPTKVDNNSFESFNSEEIRAQIFKGGDDAAESIQDLNNLKKIFDIK